MHTQDSAKSTLQRVLHQMKKCFGYAPRRGGPVAITLLSLFFIGTIAIAQEGAPPRTNTPPPQQSPTPDLPTQIVIPSNQNIPVELDTTVSTVNVKKGQIVAFRTLYSMPLGNGLELPPETQILGHVVEVKRPAHFGREGELRLAVDRIKLNTGGSVDLSAHLDSGEMKGQGRFAADEPHASDLHPVAVDAAGGALMGAVIDGAKGAGTGAGTGAALAVLILKSPRGQNVYLEQGMRFAVILDQPAVLSGAAVYAAQEEFKKHPQPSSLEPDSQGGSPQLKRRRAPQD